MQLSVIETTAVKDKEGLFGASSQSLLTLLCTLKITYDSVSAFVTQPLTKVNYGKDEKDYYENCVTLRTLLGIDVTVVNEDEKNAIGNRIEKVGISKTI